MPPPPHPAKVRALAPVTNQDKDDRIFLMPNLSIGKTGCGYRHHPSGECRAVRWTFRALEKIFSGYGEEANRFYPADHPSDVVQVALAPAP